MVRISNNLRIYECGDSHIRNHSLFVQQFKYFLAFLICTFLFLSSSAQSQGYGDRNEGDTVVVKKKTYIIHKCKKDETIFTIAAKYHVSVNDLDNANKDVINNLKKNTVLLIPVSKKKEEVKKEEAKTIPYKDLIYKIALFIPFNENSNFSVDSTLATGYSVNADLDKETISNLEFYEGIVTAVDSLKNIGLKARITVNDAYDVTTMQVAKSDAKASAADVIITNVNQTLVGKFTGYALNNKPVIISCGANTSGSIIKDSTAFFTSPASLLQCEQMSDYMAKGSMADDRFIVIKTAYPKESVRANAFSNALKGAGDKAVDKVVLDTTKQHLSALAEQLLVKGKNNVIILPTTNEAYVSDVIHYLKTLTGQFKITLVGLPTWQHFESVGPEDLQALHTTIFSSVNIEYESPAVVAFRKSFRDKYFTEPSENAFAGYDAMMFLGEQLLSQGVNFSEHITDKHYSGLSTDFHFAKERDGSGFENNYISVLRFENYALKKLNK